MNIVEYTLIAAYVVQGIEIAFFPLPSGATTYALIKKRWSLQRKLRDNLILIPFVLLTVISVCVFMMPLVLTILPGTHAVLHPIPKFHILSSEWIALAAVLCGSLLTVVAVYTLYKSRIQTADNNYALVDFGVYGWMRNPITLGLFIILAGFCMLFPLWEMWCGAAIYVFNAHIRIRMEEKELQQNYGPAYQEYKKQVNRYLPRLSQTSVLVTEPVD